MLERIENMKQQTNEVVRKMTEKYTEMQEDYLGKITRLNNDISSQREAIRSKQLLLMKKRQERDQMIIDKDNQIQDQKDEMDYQSSKFAADLKTALLTLQDRFGKAGENEGNQISTLKKLDDIVSGIH